MTIDISLKKMNNDILNELFLLHIINNNIEKVTLDLLNININVEYSFNKPLFLATKHNHLEILQILLNDHRIDPYKRFDSTESVIHYAFQHDKFECIKCIVNTKRLNHTSNDNECLYLSCLYGYHDIVKILLKSVHPQIIHLSCACCRGYIKLVQLLLDDNRVNPSEEKNQCLYNAIIHNKIPIALKLLDDERVDIDMSWSLILKAASEYTDCELIERLLLLKHINPSENTNEALFTSFQKRNMKLFYILLYDCRVFKSLMKKYAADNASATALSFDKTTLFNNNRFKYDIMPHVAGKIQRDSLSILPCFQLNIPLELIYLILVEYFNMYEYSQLSNLYDVYKKILNNSY